MGIVQWLKTHRHYWVLQDTQPVTVKGEEKKGLIRIEQCHCGMYRTIEVYPGMRPVIRESIVDGLRPGIRESSVDGRGEKPAKGDQPGEPGAGEGKRFEEAAGLSAFQGTRPC
jgi:hypothetical protein